MDAESSEVLGGFGNMGGGAWGGEGRRDSECSEIWEREYGDGRDSSEGSEGGESEPQATDGSLYIPTPERPRTVVRPILLPNRLCVFELSQLGHFVSMVNANRSCTTPGCKGNFAPIHKLGGAITVRYSCDGCNLKGATFKAHSECETVLAGSNTISVSLQVAFIIAGSTHATYCKTLGHFLGIDVVSSSTFMCTIRAMHSIVESMLDEVCEAAKQEMRDVKDQSQLGSWNNAVTVADCTWQTRGWHSKNATFTIRNYLTGALLYYHHLCQKGRDEVIEEELYRGTSKSSEGFAARVTFQKAKEEGMDVAVHWQDADSSSAKAVEGAFPDAKIMICGGHAGRAHRKILQLRQKIKKAPQRMLNRYKSSYPQLGKLTCKCMRVGKGNHSAGCGCLTVSFISRAHTNFTSILMAAQSEEEFVKRLEALPKHARDVHEWEGGRCEFHPLRVCTCKKCGDSGEIQCEGKAYKTRVKLDCEFHALLYEIECMERAKLARQLVHPILKRGHSNAVEASHNVLIRFQSKDISLERLHYHVSTNLGLLQANLTYMHAKLGTSYHWVPELYRRMHLPVFEGVVEALEKHSVKRKRELVMAKTTPAKKRRVLYKRKRILEGHERKKWSREHGHDTYGGSHHESRSDCGEGEPGDKPKCACGSTTHKCSSHRDCPFNKRSRLCAEKKGHSKSAEDVYRFTSDSNEQVSDADMYNIGSSDCASSDSCTSDESVVAVCTCGAERRAHKRGCPLSSRRGRTLFPPPSSSVVSALPRALEPEYVPDDSVTPASSREEKSRVKVGDHVCVHSRNMGQFHLSCRIVGEFGGLYQLYCSKGVLNTSFCLSELIPLADGSPISLENWRQAPKVSLHNVARDPTMVERCNCHVSICSDSIVISSASEEEREVPDLLVNNGAYRLTNSDREVVLSPTGWLTDEIICAAQMLLLQFFPNMAGLQPPVLQKVLQFHVHSGEFVQIVHVRNNHWCVVSTVGCDCGVIHVYDSLYRSVSRETLSLIASMVYSPSSELKSQRWMLRQ